MAHLDAYNRPISYLRISVTDRCNLRCVYCMPAEGVVSCTHEEILRYEEIETIVQAAAALGVSKIRLTGGEPLVRLGLADLVRILARIPGIDDLAMTSNGILLARYADELAQAGLQRVNVSLDTLRPDRFRRITRRGELADVLAGMAVARRAGLDPIKINTVVIRRMNDDEVVDFARQTVEAAWNVRFIEVMPVGNGVNNLNNLEEDWRERVVTAGEIRARIEAALGPLEPAKMRTGGGPARYYRLPGAPGTLGFITPISEHFCYQCNRLRLTADGYLRPCLLSDYEIDLRTPLRQGADVEEIKALLLEGIEHKPMHHHLDECATPEGRAMSQIGG
ncbi:MAG TPA: GTP 3',8-cyclase MoaA [Chloroflexi bacterium]|nr:GTP 3',8-cyclase MoaA [Chloroflexota bacterium]